MNKGITVQADHRHKASSVVVMTYSASCEPQSFLKRYQSSKQIACCLCALVCLKYFERTPLRPHVRLLAQMREYFEAIKGVRPNKDLSADVRRHAAEVLGTPASTLSEIGAKLVCLAALTAPHFDDQMSICYWWQVGMSDAHAGI